MDGLRGILATLVISNALVAFPAAAQSQAFASLTHTVSVTVPARVKVRVASLDVSTPIAASGQSVPTGVNGLSLSVKASQAWVLSVGSPDTQTSKSRLQRSRDGRSQFSTVTTSDMSIASGVSSVDANAAKIYFRNASSAL